ncbi:bone morphogenetic protein receptor type-1B-like [Varroa jacobsoni]|uniref:bone morphogenetic protein receptor type-1B-like n=1 Tax=Varroa jacobsoni TaxID=62625 RepID=UPI000BF6AC0A|nr:bone morphogenetic protein receptor type-1B-like [Varroa jacobsoni]
MGIKDAPTSARTITTTTTAELPVITRLAAGTNLNDNQSVRRQQSYLEKQRPKLYSWPQKIMCLDRETTLQETSIYSSSSNNGGQSRTMTVATFQNNESAAAKDVTSSRTLASFPRNSVLSSIRPLIFVLMAATSVTGSWAIECYCLGECPEHLANNTCTIDHPEAMCYHHVEEVYNGLTKKMEIQKSYGCLADQAAILTCKGHLTKHKVPMNIECCKGADLCNRDLKIDVFRHEEDHLEEDLYTDYTHLVIFVLALTMCSMVASIVYLFYRLRRKRLESSSTENEHFLSNGSKSLQELIECSITSGSGSGLPKMVQRTIARQIELNCSIGKGRYGEVFRASWKGEYVACKVFNSTEEASWCRETEIYQTTLLRHDHILGFIAADIRGHRGVTQLLLITNYHENGSLYDYLTINCLDEEQAVEMAFTACSGLFYLHTPILGKQAKPAIAHRDIKSKNILVKRDGTCCIADFGLAVRADMHANQIDIGGQNVRVGTKRYMAPEVLDETLTTSNFNSYLRADMYSFGLVLWEIASRITLPGVEKPEPYRIPYHDSVPADPTFDEMRKVVCISGDRPRIPDAWNKCETMQNLASVIRELWGHEPRSRLTVLRAKKSLAKVEDALTTKQRYSPSNQQDMHIIPPV